MDSPAASQLAILTNAPLASETRAVLGRQAEAPRGHLGGKLALQGVAVGRLHGDRAPWRWGCNRKPDIRLQLLDDEGVIINDTAIELQKSAIAVETFLQRTQDMLKVLSGVVWVFKKSQIKGRFLNIAREALRRQIPIFSYENPSKN